MIDFSPITTLLFDIDNTILIFDEIAFLPVYTKHIYPFFKTEIPDLTKFTKILLEGTHRMLQKDSSGLTNLDKFTVDFASKTKTLTSFEVKKRFLEFYQTEFSNIKQIIDPHPIAKVLLTHAANQFTLVAATNPVFPAIANEIRLNWGNLGKKYIDWTEITSAEDYHYGKPDLEYYQEILERIDKTPSECIMIGNDPINDMVAGKIGLKTFLVTGDKIVPEKIIQTELDHKKPKFQTDYSGTLKEFYEFLKQYK